MINSALERICKSCSMDMDTVKYELGITNYKTNYVELIANKYKDYSSILVKDTEGEYTLLTLIDDKMKIYEVLSDLKIELGLRDIKITKIFSNLMYDILKTFNIQEYEKKSIPVLLKLMYIYAIGISKGASDIHIDTHIDRTVTVKHCINTELVPMKQSILSYEEAEVSVKELLASSDKNIESLKVDGHVNFAIRDLLMDGDNKYQARVTIQRKLGGTSTVYRLIDDRVPKIKDLKFHVGISKQLMETSQIGRGLIILGGAMGQGKNTTAYGIINEWRSYHKNILTIENPVEKVINDINQIDIGYLGLSYENTLEAVVRQNVGYLFIGEINEPNVAKLALQSSIIGVMTMSTLHVNRVSEVYSRLNSLLPNRYYDILQCVKTSLNQKLLKCLCPHCKRPIVDVEADEYADAYKMKDRFYYEPVGCEFCNYTGYVGRQVVGELLMSTDKLRNELSELPNALALEIYLNKKLFKEQKSIYHYAMQEVCCGNVDFKQLISLGIRESYIE